MEFLDKSELYRHWKHLITVMLGTGMRVGEVTGLRWKDIDLEQGTIDVNHTLVFYNKEHKSTYAINTTKTPASKRIVPMIDSVKEAFLEEKRHQEETGIYCISVVDGFSDFVFCNRFGEILNLGVINKALRSKVKIEPLFEEFVDFETFSKSDFRAVKNKNCEEVPKSDKLLKFTLNNGSGEDRVILSGIKKYYDPAELVGKTAIAITNLPPRKMDGTVQ